MKNWPHCVRVILIDGNTYVQNLKFRMDLAFWLFLSWIVVLVCLAKGIRSSGKVSKITPFSTHCFNSKVVYFTATFPYLILLVLLSMSVTLPGASNGIHYLFVPTWEKLADFQVFEGLILSEPKAIIKWCEGVEKSCKPGILLPRHLLGWYRYVWQL